MIPALQVSKNFSNAALVVNIVQIKFMSKVCI